MNIFFNTDENRLRAGWRIASQLFLMFLIGLGLIWMVSRFYTVSGQTLPVAGLALGAVISVALAVRGMDLRPFTDLGITPSSISYREGFFGFLLAGLVMASIFVTEYTAGWINVVDFGWQQVGTGSYLLSFIAYFAWMLMVGFYEELVFRGYQIVNLAEGFNLPDISRQQAVIGSVALSSFIFGILHATNPSASWISSLNVMLAGAMLALPFVITGRLALSIGLHAGWNFFQGGVFGFPVSGVPTRAALLQVHQQGPEMITGGGFGPEAGLLGVLGFVMIAGALLIYFKKTDQPITIHSRFGVYTASTRNYPT